MNANLDSIKKGLGEIGACFATSTSKFICANHNCCQPLDGDKPAYHIHPDACNPRQDDIKRFESLGELKSWIKMQKAASAAPSQDAAYAIAQEWDATH